MEELDQVIRATIQELGATSKKELSAVEQAVLAEAPGKVDAPVTLRAFGIAGEAPFKNYALENSR